MGLETATYLDSLVSTWPDGSDARNTSDDHHRLIKACLKRTFPNIASEMSASSAELNTLKGVVGRPLELSRSYSTTISFNAPGFNVNGVSVINETGSFTGTLTGMSGATTGTIYWYRVGQQITLYSKGNILGTSNASTLTMTGVPAALQCTSEKRIPCHLTNNSGQHWGVGLLGAASDTITFYLGWVGLELAPSSVNITGFHTSGSKGFSAGWHFPYIKD